MNCSLVEYIKDYLESAITTNNYYYVVSHKQKRGYKIIKRPEVPFNDCDITNYLKFSDRFNNIILDFNQRFKEVFPDKYLALFNKNIKTVNMIDYKLNTLEKLKLLFNTSSTGSYDSYKNEIELLKNAKKDWEVRKIINHELLHMSSSVDLIFLGFSQEIPTKKGFTQIGNGINEGYTEYLNKTYFTECEKYSYHDQVQFAAMIENIVGKEFMLECYFEKGLISLIKKIGEIYNDEGKAIDLILDLDNLLGKSNSLFNKEKYTNVRFDLADLYNIELNRRLKLGIINEEKYRNERLFHINRFILGDDFNNEESSKGKINNKIYFKLDSDSVIKK